MAKEEEKQVNEAQFLKNMNKHKVAAKAAAKAERPTGILDDAAILDRLGLAAEGDRITVNARCTKVQIGYAKGDMDRMFFRFAYNLSDHSPLSGKGKGLLVSNYYELSEGVSSKTNEVYRTIEEAYERLFFEFQGLGENTKEWDDPNAEAVKAAKKHTQAKTEVSLSISTYARSNGDLGMNIRLVGAESEQATDNSDLEESEGESLAEWVDCWVTWTDDDGSVDFLVESFDDEERTLSGKDEDGEEYEGAPIDQCEYAEDQRDSE